jgi:hypothetical protein
MIAKELIDILKNHQNAHVEFKFGKDKLYRQACAKLINEQPLDVNVCEDKTQILEFLDITAVNADLKAKTIELTLEQLFVEDKVIYQEEKKIKEAINKRKEGE